MKGESAMDKSKHDISYVPILFPWINLFPPVEEKLKVVKKTTPQVEDEESEMSFLRNRPVMDD